MCIVSTESIYYYFRILFFIDGNLDTVLIDAAGISCLAYLSTDIYFFAED